MFYKFSMVPAKPRAHLLKGMPPDKRAHLDDLRQLLSPPNLKPGKGRFFTFGLPLDRHLPREGLSLESLHEIHAASLEDLPAALGFLLALAVALAGSGPVFIITSAQGPVSSRTLYGHGLNALGLDPARVTLIDARNDADAFWAIEETLRSGAARIVAGLIAGSIDLKKSQRLSLATREARRPLLLLRPAKSAVASAAETRWRIGAAPACRSSAGDLLGWRWRVILERCRNGSTGEWVLEWLHASHRFGLAAALADPAFPDSARIVRANRA
jgi:protein ImuA